MNFGKHNKNYQQTPANFYQYREDAYQFKTINPVSRTIVKSSSQDRIQGIGFETRLASQKSPTHYNRPDSHSGYIQPQPLKNTQNFQNFQDNFSTTTYSREATKQKKDEFIVKRDEKTKLIEKVKKFQEELALNSYFFTVTFNLYFLCKFINSLTLIKRLISIFIEIIILILKQN